MRKNFFLCFALLLIAHLVMAGQVATLSEVSIPELIYVQDSNLYVVEGIHLFVYSLKDYSLIHKIGKPGEGPGEFKHLAGGVLCIVPTPMKDKIMVSSTRKVSYFTLDGKFIKEEKSTAIIGRYVPVGDKLVGMTYRQENKEPFISYNLYSTPSEKIQELFKSPVALLPGTKIDPIHGALQDRFLILPYAGDKAVIPLELENKILIFDSQGKTVADIGFDESLIEVSGDIEKELDRLFSTDIRFKTLYTQLKGQNRIKFADHLPAIREMRVGDGKIYSVSFHKKDGKSLTTIFDMQGKVLQKVYLPLFEANLLELHPFTFHGNKIYQLVEDEEAEEWQLHITDIK